MRFIDIDECSSNPCVNGGKCENDVNGYRCICLAGYKGSRCEQGTSILSYLDKYSVCKMQIYPSILDICNLNCFNNLLYVGLIVFNIKNILYH